MQTIQRSNLRTLTALAAGTVLTIGLQMTASAATPEGAVPAHGGQKMERDWAGHRQEQMAARLAKAAERLGIQPAQQTAWQAYVNAIESPLGNAHKPHEPHEMATDAASIARHRADIAAAYAAKMMNVAETTASLQAVLTPEQQQTFDKMVKHAQHHHRG
jgi:hypothetical protein